MAGWWIWITRPSRFGANESDRLKLGSTGLLKRDELVKTSVLERAQDAVAKRLLSIRGSRIFRSDYPRYTISVEGSLVPGVTRQDFWDDLINGDGNELSDTPKAPAKFCAAYSSAALVVNTFGPFRHSAELLALAGYSDFRKAQFERKCSTGLKGRKPNLDFVVGGLKAVVAVESKFLEIIRPVKPVEFRRSYGSVIRTNAEPAWKGIYEALLDDPMKFIHLDAAQLVKHYLGIRNTFRDCQADKVLVYLFWEPTNAEDISEFREHRREVTSFSRVVEASDVRFIALSYSELWRYWSKTSSWPGTIAHIEVLKQRYELSI